MHTGNRILAAAAVLILVTVACSFNINIPTTKINTGPTQTLDIRVPLPADSSAGVELNLEFVAGEMKLAPGTGEALASGTATYNVAEFKPKVEGTGSSYTVSQPDLKIEGIPNFSNDVRNEWDLQLANTPMSLNIKAGAYKGNFELGGLSLEKLAISDGAAEVTAAFSEPNRVEMSSFTYTTGTSKVSLKGLANANFQQMTFTSGAGDYTLSFDGDLQRDAPVTVESGAGTVNIIVPEGANAQVTFDSGLSKVTTAGSRAQNGTLYTHSGSGPTITITVKMGAGTLNLKTG
jgi:N-terminal domain of toast_rack, DUF2154